MSRVGRYSDKCERILATPTSPIDVEAETLLFARLFNFTRLMSNKKPAFKILPVSDHQIRKRTQKQNLKDTGVQKETTLDSMWANGKQARK